MLKVKKKIPDSKNKSQDEDLTQLHNEINNSITNLYITDQKKRKKQLTNMQNLLQKQEMNMQNYKKKNSELKIELQKFLCYRNSYMTK